MNKGRLLTTVSALAFGAALVLSGCGGSSGGKRLTKEGFAQKANSICADYLLKVDAFGNTKNEAEAVKLIVDTRALYAQSIANMKKLEPPTDEQAAVDRAMKLAEQQLGIIDQEIAALRKRDTAKVTKALERGKVITKESNLIFSQLGATTCTR